MDFMKAFDQTVREIKREVNLKVLKVPEIEQKVLDATSDEPWGPHGSALSEIAHQTKKFTECQQIMSVLWTRLADSGANWRHVYKALAVIEYLVANGSERAVDDIIEHTFQITALSGFEHVEPNGKDMGINVRKKVESILGLLNDREKIKAVRDKAVATRDKFFGLSSSGVTFKSSSASYSSSIHNSGYGGFSGSREGDTFKSKYTYNDNSKESHETHTSHNERNKYAKGIAHNERETKPHTASSSGEPGDEDDFDDFNPRGYSTDGSTTANSTKLDLFGDSLIDIMDDPPSTSNDSSRNVAASVVDLFEDATFVSAPVRGEVPVDFRTQENVDLFARQTAAPPAFPSQVDLFGTSNSAPTATKTLQSGPINTPSVDPFSTIPLTTFEGSDLLGGLTSNSNSKPEPPQNSEFDLFGDFTSNSNPVNSQSSQDSGSDIFGDFTSNNNSLKLQPSQDTGFDPFADFASNSKTLKSESSQNSIGDLSQSTTTSTQSKQKSNFQVKSGIWADSLSRGIIDLNISAPKKISLADVGVVGSLDDAFEDKGKYQPTSAFMGRSIGTGTGLAKSTIPYSTESTGSFSNLDPHQQFGSFK